MITGAKDGALTMEITTSPENTTFGKVFKNNMDDKSYTNSIEEALKRILTEPKSAHLVSFDSIQPKEEYLKCLVDHVWKYRVGYGSFMNAKDSPYKIFFNSIIMKMSEDGRLQNLYKIWIDKQRFCPKREEVPLGIEKTISMFFIIFLGMIGAMIFIVIEKVRSEKLWLDNKEKPISPKFEGRTRILHLMKDWIIEEIHNIDMKENHKLDVIEQFQTE